MLTRRKASVVVRPEAAHAVLPPLPTTCVWDILSRLTPGERLLSMQVSHAWRAAVCAPAVWRCVDLTPCGCRGERVTERLLRAIVAKAAGHVHTLRLYVGVGAEKGALSAAAARTAVQLGPTLRVLELVADPFRDSYGFQDARTVDEILAAAPNLCSFAVDVYATPTEAHALLCNEGRYQCLRLRRLLCHHAHDVEPSSDDADAFVAALASDLGRHASLRELSVDVAEAAASLDGLVNAVTDACLAGLSLEKASQLQLFATPLTRLLLDARRLVALSFSGHYGPIVGLHSLLSADTVAPSAAALRANSWLTRLELMRVRLWDTVERGEAVVAALVDHASVTHINLGYNPVLPADRQTVGAALAQLVAANAPALAFLGISYARLGEEGLRSFLAALPRNTYLRELGCSELYNSNITKNFVRSTLVPAVKANTSLRRLRAGEHAGPAEKLVVARAAASEAS